MGNSHCEKLIKIRDQLQFTQPWQKSSFYEQETSDCQDQIAKKCLVYLSEINPQSFNSIKKAYRYLCPALKYHQKVIQSYIDNNSESEKKQIDHPHEADLFKQLEGELRMSAQHILMLYFNFLVKVVPANISYFHFIREKDFCVHYTAIKYILKLGLISLGHSKHNIFQFIAMEQKIQIFDNFSHWLYDMTKYWCSAIALSSRTLPYLIRNLNILICGLLTDNKLSILQNYGPDLIYKIYKHTMWPLLYLLCKHNKEKCYSGVQIVIGGISKAIKQMYGDGIREVLHETYFPSFLYVQQIGYVKEPTLQKIAFLVMIDMLKNRQQIGPRTKQKVKRKNILKKIMKKKPKKMLANIQSDTNMYTADNFERNNADQLEEISDDQNQDEEQIEYYQQESFIKMEPMREITSLQLIDTITNLLVIFPHLRECPEIVDLVLWEMQKMNSDSFMMPYILGIIELLSLSGMGSSNLLSQRQEQEQDEAEFRHKNKQLQKMKTSPSIVGILKKYLEKNSKIKYSVSKYIIQREIVRKNCSIALDEMMYKMIEYYVIEQQQLAKSKNQIWNEIVKYNQHSFLLNEEATQ